LNLYHGPKLQGFLVTRLDLKSLLQYGIRFGKA
jgi:hypothetical protein